MTTKQRETMVRRLEREWQAAVRREESADTTERAWSLAARSDRALERLRAARAGVALPCPRTRRNMAKGAFVALATIGKVIAKSFVLAERLRQANAVNAARRAGVIRVVTTTYGAMRRAVMAVVRFLTTATHEVVAFFRPFNRVAERMKVQTVRFEAPVLATALELVELAHQAGASKGERTKAGVFELQTDDGCWQCPDGIKLLTRSHSGLSPRAAFQTWDQLEAEVVS